MNCDIMDWTTVDLIAVFPDPHLVIYRVFENGGFLLVSKKNPGNSPADAIAGGEYFFELKNDKYEWRAIIIIALYEGWYLGT